MGQYYRTKWNLGDQFAPRILYLCEGKSEADYVDTWLTKRNENSDDICVLCFEGLGKISSKISVLGKEPNFPFVNTICIFLDAEQNFDQRKRDIKKHLKHLGFPHSGSNDVPWVESNEGKKSCVYISPDMNSSGRIEDIVIKELRDKTDVFNCIDRFKQCSLRTESSSFDEKQVVQSYITMHCTGLSLGASFQKGLFDLDHPAYTNLNSVLEAAIT